VVKVDGVGVVVWRGRLGCGSGAATGAALFGWPVCDAGWLVGEASGGVWAVALGGWGFAAAGCCGHDGAFGEDAVGRWDCGWVRWD
jgi:hypothetical protein